MEISHRIEFVDGNFETKTGELIAVSSTKYNDVNLCIKSNMHITIAKIKLHSRDRFVDAKAIREDAYKLAKEIARRFNEFPENEKK